MLGLDYEAIEDFSMAIQLDPKEISAFVNRYMIYLKLNKYPEAIQDCNEVINLNPLIGKTYAHRADAKFQLGDVRGALMDYKRALQDDMLNEEYLIKKAYCLIQLNQLSEAIQNFDAILLLNPKNKEAYLNRGSAKLLNQDIEGACLDWSKSGELGHIDAYKLIREYCQ